MIQFQRVSLTPLGVVSGRKKWFLFVSYSLSKIRQKFCLKIYVLSSKLLNVEAYLHKICELIVEELQRNCAFLVEFCEIWVVSQDLVSSLVGVSPEHQICIMI